MEVTSYKKCILFKGDKTKEYKDELKAGGAKWNRTLVGWIATKEKGVELAKKYIDNDEVVIEKGLFELESPKVAKVAKFSEPSYGFFYTKGVDPNEYEYTKKDKLYKTPKELLDKIFDEIIECEWKAACEQRDESNEHITPKIDRKLYDEIKEEVLGDIKGIDSISICKKLNIMSEEYDMLEQYDDYYFYFTMVF